MPYQEKEQATLSVDTQGDTGSPSRIKIVGTNDGSALLEPFGVRVRVCDEDGYTDATNATIAVDTGYGVVTATHSATKDLDIVSVDANASGVLTLTGVASDGETVTLGARVYEFDTDGLVTEGNVTVDVSGSAVASEGTLTVDTQVTALDSFEIDGKGFVFVADGDEGTDGEISIGTDLATCQANIVAAINGTDHNIAHPTVTAAAFATNASVITASAPGASGEAISTTSNFTTGTNLFDATTLGTTTTGTGVAAGAAITALVAAITGDGSAVVTAADGAGDTVDVTAVADGYAGNSVDSTETMANGSFAAATLVQGSIPSEIFVNLTDASVETVTLRLGAAEIEGLVAEYHGTALNVAHAAP